MLIFHCNIEVFDRFHFFSESQIFYLSDSFWELWGAFGDHFGDFGWFEREVEKGLNLDGFRVPPCGGPELAHPPIPPT
jgi:hypothetical protein